MKIEKVSTHMDTDCPGKPCPQPQPSKPTKFGFAPSRSAGTSQAASSDRLPSINYDLMKEPQLKKRMRDNGIPDWGARPLLIRRHKEWVMIWNANCDSSRPRTKQKLLQDLNTWEQTQGGHANTSSASTQLGAQIKDKDFDGAGWSTKHNNSFKDLIAQARKSRKVAENPPQEGSSSANETGVESPHIDGVGGRQLPTAMETDEPQPVQAPVKSSATIELKSPVRLCEERGSHVLAGEEVGTHT